MIHHFLIAYLVAWLLCLGISLGSLSLTMLHHLTGGAWGVLIRRPAEAAAMTLPLLAILFVPIVVGFPILYPWANPARTAAQHVLQHRHAMFNPGMVLLRAALYFAVWIFFAWRLRQISHAQDQLSIPETAHRARRISAAGLVVYFITMSFASVDWIASRETHWYSSVFGLLVIMGQSVASLAFLLLTLHRLRRHPSIQPILHPDHLHDLGNLLLTIVVLWAYINFAQFLVIWMGNTQEDNLWYVHRTRGLWQLIAILLILLHFALPFVLLLIQQSKRRLGVLAAISAGLLLLRWLDLIYMVGPSDLDALTYHPTWPEPLAVLLVGLPWLLTFRWLLHRRSLIVTGEVSLPYPTREATP